MYDEWDEIGNELSKLSNLIENENKICVMVMKKEKI